MVEYDELFAAIWKEAVTEDEEKSVNHLALIGRREAFKTYCKNQKNEHPLMDDKRFAKIYTEIRAYSKMKVQTLLPRIRELVYQESQEWPDNLNLLSKDEEYKEGLTALEDEVREFAHNRMTAVWRRL